jgi:hypothetical protein
MACELLEAPLAVSEMSENEAIEAANYTADYYFSVDAATFLSRLHDGSISVDDHRVGRVLSMVEPVRTLIEAR